MWQWIVAAVTLTDGVGIDDFGAWVTALTALMVVAVAVWRGVYMGRGSVFGRSVLPFEFALTGATWAVAFATVTGQAVGAYLDGPPGKAVAAAAFAGACLLVAGWWYNSARMLNQGLLIAAAAWASVATVIALESASWVSASLAAWWSVAAAGTWIVGRARARGDE